jgi:ABC-type multidrug transport system fused ATPase/permease subunit
MSEERIPIEQVNETSRLQPETFNEMFGNLTGLTKKIAIKIFNTELADNVKKNLNNYGVKNSSDALKKLIEMAVQKSVKGIRTKIAVILTIIIGIIALIAIIVTLAASGNIIIPIVIFAILILITWLITEKIFKQIAYKISGKIFKTIEGKMTQFVDNSKLEKNK